MTHDKDRIDPLNSGSFGDEPGSADAQARPGRKDFNHALLLRPVSSRVIGTGRNSATAVTAGSSRAAESAGSDPTTAKDKLGCNTGTEDFGSTRREDAAKLPDAPRASRPSEWGPPTSRAVDPALGAAHGSSIPTIELVSRPLAPDGKPETVYRAMQRNQREMRELRITRVLEGKSEELRSIGSARSYVSVALACWDESAWKRSIPDEACHYLTPVEYASDIIASKQRLAPSSWNSLKYAALFFVSLYRDKNEQYEKAYQMLVNEKVDSGPQKEPKFIPKRDFLKLTSCLARSPPPSKVSTGNWLKSVLATGLRPCEWLLARWENDKKESLIVVNAKLKRVRTNFGRRNGYSIHDIARDHPETILPGDYFHPEKHERTVPVEVEDRDVVDAHLAAVARALAENPSKSREENFKTFYDRCRAQLAEACRTLFPDKRPYNLMQARSQCVANLKAILPLAEVSRRVGHSPDGRTTQSSYGHRSKAFPSKRLSQREHQVDDHNPKDSPKSPKRPRDKP